MEINLGENIIIKRGSRPTPLSKYEVNKQIINSIPYPIQSDLNKNTFILDKCKKFIKTDLDFKFTPAKKGDLLMSSSCDIGNVAILGFKEAFIDDKFFRLEVSNNVKINYLKYWIIKNKKEISDLGYGTTFKMLYIEPFKNFLNEKFIPNLEVQQEIINIIEPKEDLFLKYHSIIDISNLDVFKESWYNLINIIEPFEKLKNHFFKKNNELKNFFDSFDINNSFSKVKLKNISNITTGKRNANFATLNGLYRFFTCSSNKIQFCDSYSYNCEAIMLSGNGDIGNVEFFKGKFDAYQRTYVIETELIGNVFFELKKKKSFFLQNSKGSVIKFLTLSTINDIEINTNEFLNSIRYKILILSLKYEEINWILDKIINLLINLFI